MLTADSFFAEGQPVISVRHEEEGALRTPEIFKNGWMRSPGSTTKWRRRRTRCCSRHADFAMHVTRAQGKVDSETAHVYTDTRYAATAAWDHERRDGTKAEVVRLGDFASGGTIRASWWQQSAADDALPRRHGLLFITADMREWEQRNCSIGCRSTWTSCCLLSANQLRVDLTDAAYVTHPRELRLSGGAYCVCTQQGGTRLRAPSAEAGGPHRPLGPNWRVLHLPRSTTYLETVVGTSHSR